MENYDRNPAIKKLVDERVFYIVPTVNPDGMDFFYHGTGSGARTGHVPVDEDGDGVFDEDGPDDLNGNGVIEQIRKYVPGRGHPPPQPRRPPHHGGGAARREGGLGPVGFRGLGQ